LRVICNTFNLFGAASKTRGEWKWDLILLTSIMTEEGTFRLIFARANWDREIQSTEGFKYTGRKNQRRKKTCRKKTRWQDVFGCERGYSSGISLSSRPGRNQPSEQEERVLTFAHSHGGRERHERTYRRQPSIIFGRQWQPKKRDIPLKGVKEKLRISRNRCKGKLRLAAKEAVPFECKRRGKRELRRAIPFSGSITDYTLGT